MSHVIRVAQEVGGMLLGRGKLMEVTLNCPAENRTRESSGRLRLDNGSSDTNCGRSLRVLRSESHQYYLGAAATPSQLLWLYPMVTQFCPVGYFWCEQICMQPPCQPDAREETLART